MPATTYKSTRASPAMEDDIDAITPAPPTPEPKPQQEHIEDPTCHEVDYSHCGYSIASASSTNTTRSSSPTSQLEGRMGTSSSVYPHGHLDDERRRDSVRALEEGTDGDPARLWRRMLALQQHYGCYKSARMSAALESGDQNLLIPSSACLHMMNEDMAELPEEAGEVIEGWRSRIRNKVRKGAN